MLTITLFHKKIPKNHTITLFQISYCPGKAEFPTGKWQQCLEEQQTHQHGPFYAPKRFSDDQKQNPLDQMSAIRWFLNICNATAK